VYQDQIMDFPAPEFYYNDFYTAEKIDGWIDVLVPADEHNLILVFSPTYDDGTDFTRYIALEDGASIPISAELAGIQPTDLGKDQANPAPFGAKTVSDDWETQILEIVRGEAAWQALLEANPDIEPPTAGMEYLIAHIRLRFISSREGRASIYFDNFFSVGSKGEEYRAPMVLSPQTPGRNWISSHIYPGLEVDGWTVLQVSVGETGTIIIFKPDLHAHGMPENNIRYLLAQP
jgi:hypothetical protein